MRIAVVQGGDAVQSLAAGLFEQFAVLHGDRLERLETVHRETRTDDLNASDAAEHGARLSQLVALDIENARFGLKADL